MTAQQNDRLKQVSDVKQIALNLVFFDYEELGEILRYEAPKKFDLTNE